MSEPNKVGDYMSGDDLSAFEGDATPQAEGNDQSVPGQDEPTFEVDGQKIPYSQLTPELVKQFYDSHANRNKWQSENTRKAQEIAKQKKEWETKYPSYEKKLKDFDQLDVFVKQHPELQTELQQLFGKYASKSASQGPQPFGRDPAFEQLMNEVNELKSWKKERETESQTEKMRRDEEQALAKLKSKYPDLNEQEFIAFKDQMAEQAGNSTETLYEMLFNAFRGQNPQAIAKKAEKKTLENIKNKQKSAVETGKQTSPIKLPDNLDARKMDYAGLMEELLKEGK